MSDSANRNVDDKHFDADAPLYVPGLYHHVSPEKKRDSGEAMQPDSIKKRKAPAFSADTAGPNCFCGINTVSEASFKGGPFKNRPYWVRIANTFSTTMRLINDYSSLTRITPDSITMQVCSKSLKFRCSHFKLIDEAKPLDTSLTAQAGGACFECGDPDHWSSKCPSAGAGYRRTTSDFARRYIDEEHFDVDVDNSFCYVPLFYQMVSPEKKRDSGEDMQPDDIKKENTPAYSADTAGPHCMCGISAVSRFPFSNGENKNRAYWVRTANTFSTSMRLMHHIYSWSLIRITPDPFLFMQICSKPRKSQCSYFELRDQKESSNSSTTAQVKDETTAQVKDKTTAQVKDETTAEVKDETKCVVTTCLTNQQKLSPTGPPCKCNLASIQRTTMREGPNQGRNFWVSSDQFVTVIIIRDINVSPGVACFQRLFHVFRFQVCNAPRGSDCIFFVWENAELNSPETYFAGKSACYKCGDPGHWSRNCPSLGAGYRQC